MRHNVTICSGYLLPHNKASQTFMGIKQTICSATVMGSGSGIWTGQGRASSTQLHDVCDFGWEDWNS